MARNHSLLNRVTKIIDKQAKRNPGLSFTIYFDDDPNPEVYRTRGYKQNDSNNNQPTPTQTTTGETND